MSNNPTNHEIQYLKRIIRSYQLVFAHLGWEIEGESDKVAKALEKHEEYIKKEVAYHSLMDSMDSTTFKKYSTIPDTIANEELMGVMCDDCDVLELINQC